MANPKRNSPHAKASGHTNLKTGANLPSIPSPPRAPVNPSSIPVSGRTGKGKMPPKGSGPGMPGHS